LAAELRLNAEVLLALRDEVLPCIVAPRRSSWNPGLGRTAIAAAALLAVAVTALHHRPRAPFIASTTDRGSLNRQLKVKLLTPDPDVVIYWLIDQKEDVAK
jgi:hypothetical protein